MLAVLNYTLIKYRLPLIVVLHLFFASGALLFSFLLRFDFSLGHDNYPLLFFYSLPISIVVFMLCSGFFNLFQGIWRYVSVDDLKDIVKTSAIASLVFMFVIIISGEFKGYPRSIYVLNFALFIILNGGTRFAIRIFRESFYPRSDTAKNVLIVGAGTAGNEVVKTLKTAKRKDYVPVGFIDRDKTLHGKRIQGIKVLGDITSIRQAVKRHRVHEIFIAIPEATNKLVKEIISASKVNDWGLNFKIVPSMLDIMSGKLLVNQIRDVSIEDLLSRPDIKLNDTHVRKQLAGKTVLITGAGGSIGSEIAYQVAAYSPARIILLDASEMSAYHVDQGLKTRHPGISIHTVVGNLLETGFMEMLFRRYPPDYIYHAAAYKHVHLMEWNPLGCLKNNVLATAHLASMAERFGVKQFVMISTDKAVHPKGIMGISKRLAERVVLERNPSGTLFNVVRFGNVLGSSGSVIPLFKKQIREGGPVTVTSPETKRYFMSIPEAVQLVLQASTLNESKAIFMLDMGNPVKIVDLAKNLIELSGLKTGEDIDIVYTGMRDGEKIEEVLLAEQEDLLPTKFDKIRLQKRNGHDPELVEKFIHELKSNVELANVPSVYRDIKKMIPEMEGPSYDEFVERIFT
ncbi:nucleoside-diphosphate sugar epimerase/dehydratase [Chitinispirillales bacterium ANBcel5]|uniref:polysaccharide biosynthesis protein n=1 Tax=Cellulosispirillum alkaliphilum TaxID=3039283 RepID=UPI002A57F20A|nr:nucleoside-diphosphate sugar epimerase/dehydratase [Chitinispirillales bacterium ANBcel5]